jgi:hypothetical protein
VADKAKSEGTKYVILQKQSEQGAERIFVVRGTVTANGAEGAMRKWAVANVKPEDGRVALVAVPARSFVPAIFKIETEAKLKMEGEKSFPFDSVVSTPAPPEAA